MAGKGTAPNTNTVITKYITFFTTGNGANDGVVTMAAINPSSINIGLKRVLEAEGDNAAPEIKENIPEIKKVIELQAKSMNLDPRYSEERTSETDTLKAPRAPNDEAGSGGWTAVKEDSVWKSNAALRDAPGHKIRTTDVVNGDETFETAAMADGSEFLGSVRWGYTVSNSVSALNPAAIELVNYGSASGELFQAAKKWNAMKVPDMYDEDVKHSTLQLPESDGAKNSALTVFELSKWMKPDEAAAVMAALGRATIERHYSTTALGRIRSGVDTIDQLVTLVIKLTEARGPDAVTRLGAANDEYSTKGYKDLCAKPVGEILTSLYPTK